MLTVWGQQLPFSPSEALEQAQYPIPYQSPKSTCVKTDFFAGVAEGDVEAVAPREAQTLRPIGLLFWKRQRRLWLTTEVCYLFMLLVHSIAGLCPTPVVGRYLLH